MSPKKIALAILIASLTLIPPLRLAYFLFTTGENCANNDDITYLEQFEKMSAPGYDWSNYFADTFIDGHCAAFNQLLFNLYVVFGHLNQNLGAAIGLALIALRLWLLFDLLLPKDNKWRWLCLPLFSAIIFAPTAASILTQGSFAITWQASLTASALSLWCLFKLPGLKSILLAAIAMLLGSYTIATALMSFPIAWVCAWRLKKLNLKATAIFSVASLLALLPYILYLPHGVSTSKPLSSFLKPIDFTMFLSSLGRNFAPGTAWYVERIAPAEVFSTLGLIILTAFILLLRQAEYRQEYKEKIPAIDAAAAVCFFAVGNLILTTMVRPVIAPWYGQVSNWFWIGLTAIAASFLNQNKATAKIVAATALISIGCFCAFSTGIEDKEFFLDNRSPAYLSVLRNHYDPPAGGLVPTYKYLPLKPSRLATMLEKYHFVPFAKDDIVFFQGDCVVPGLVQFRNDAAEEGKIFFAEKDPEKPLSTASYKRLNLFLDGAITALWKIKLPANARKIELVTEVKQNRCRIVVDKESHDYTQGDSVRINLLPYAGKEIVVQLQNQHHSGDRALTLASPQIQISQSQ